jgi:hypothetical protein
VQNDHVVEHPRVKADGPPSVLANPRMTRLGPGADPGILITLEVSPAEFRSNVDLVCNALTPPGGPSNLPKKARTSAMSENVRPSGTDSSAE